MHKNTSPMKPYTPVYTPRENNDLNGFNFLNKLKKSNASFKL